MTVLPFQTEWTVDDLDALPDDGLRHELIDGLHIVSPAPIPHHQFVVARLTVNLQPDVLVVPASDVTDRDAKNLTRPLLLAVEVLSPSTRRKDRVLTFDTYQKHGVASYWIVDPVEPSITCWDLLDGAYVEVGHASGDQPVSLTRPFPVTIVPADLVRRSGTMSVVALHPVSPGAEGWTVEDLDHIPDDGVQRELLDGMLLMSPGPVGRHQLAAVRLAAVRDQCRTASSAATARNASR